MTSPLYCILVCIPECGCVVGRQEGWNEGVLFLDQACFLNKKIKCLITGWRGIISAKQVIHKTSTQNLVFNSQLKIHTINRQ